MHPGPLGSSRHLNGLGKATREAVLDGEAPETLAFYADMASVMPDKGGDGVTAYSCRHCGSVALDERRRQCCGETMEQVAVDAVNEPDVRTLAPQVFGISATGLDICLLLMEQEDVTIDDIAATLEVNRTTASRQLNQLQALGIVERREESLEDGGQLHIYTPHSLEEVRQRHREALLGWVADAMTLLDGLDQQKLAAAAQRDFEE